MIEISCIVIICKKFSDVLFFLLKIKNKKKMKFLFLILFLGILELVSSFNSSNFCNLKLECIQIKEQLNCSYPKCNRPFVNKCGNRCTTNHLECKAFMNTNHMLHATLFDLTDRFKRRKLMKNFLLFKESIKQCPVRQQD